MADENLRAVAFPRLGEADIASLARCTAASVERYRAGEPLFQAGDRDFKFFVVRSGEIEILDPSTEAPRTVTVHGPGEFTGDVSHLTGGTSLVSAVARTDCEVYAISRETLRQILSRCPSVGDLLLQAFIARRQLVRTSESFSGIRVIGSRHSKDTFRIREFLAKNGVPFQWLDLETDEEVDRLLKRFSVGEAETPVVAWGARLLRNPTNRELAEVLGIRRPLERAVYDLVVVGAGPAGLAAAVYGASEGLTTVLLERLAPGGQAGSSMRIENYLGFPTGVSGADLAERAVLQASKFGARLSVPTPVIELTFDQRYPIVGIDGGETLVAKCLLIATGADYRRLDVLGCERFEGCGVYYAATFIEAQLCRGSDVVVVGGGNSSGQASVFLSAHVRKVFHLIRGDDLYKNMSSYLAQRIEGTDNIELHKSTIVTRMLGNGELSEIETRNLATGQERTIPTRALFSFIGAVPRTDWLPEGIDTDPKGFVGTGPGMKTGRRAGTGREPFPLETSRRGVFAAGDVRSGSIKRVASAVGEGAMAIQFVHEYLKEM